MNPPDTAPAAFGPLKPRPKLFVLLCAAFALWLIALAILYFATVYPLRHPEDQASRPSPTLPN